MGRIRAGLVSGFWAFTILVAVSGVVLNVPLVKGDSGTIYIRADGSIDPSDAPISTFDNVTYTFTDNITVESIVVERNNIVVDGANHFVYPRRPGYSYRGIYLFGRSNVTIKNVEIKGFTFGICLEDSSFNNLSGNNVMASIEAGIWLNSSSNNNLSWNNATENYEYGIRLQENSDFNSLSRNNATANNYDGISISLSNNNSLSRNTATANGWDGIALALSCNNSLSGNIAAANTNNGIRVYLRSNHNNLSENNVTANDHNGILVDWHSDYNSLSGTIATTNTDYGIKLDMASSNSVSGNNVANNARGIGLFSWLYNSSNYNSFSGNNVTNNKSWGLYIEESSTNNIFGNVFINDGLVVGSSGNMVRDNLVNGKPLIYLEDVSDFTIGNAGQVILVNCTRMKVENLDLSNASIGVQLRSTDDSEISGNNITNNVGGVTVHYSWNNILSENSIANNAWGIEFLFSSLNVVCHNNFINNGVHVSSRSGSLNLVWSYGYPSGGNYWSDYTGVDLDHDGIGDTGYVIIGDEIDHYPLMGRFSDFNATSEHHVQTLCNSSITDFHFNGTAISFYVSGGNGTTGFCRICIPAALMNGTYRVFVNETEVSCNLLPCSDSTHKYLYFNYTHSTQEVVIVPEFPSFLIQPLFMIATLLAVIVYKRKHTVRQI